VLRLRLLAGEFQIEYADKSQTVDVAFKAHDPASWLPPSTCPLARTPSP
jgi:hypothetical protein